jgi:hypothetical protein
VLLAVTIPILCAQGAPVSNCPPLTVTVGTANDDYYFSASSSVEHNEGAYLITYRIENLHAKYVLPFKWEAASIPLRELDPKWFTKQQTTAIDYATRDSEIMYSNLLTQKASGTIYVPKHQQSMRDREFDPREDRRRGPERIVRSVITEGVIREGAEQRGELILAVQSEARSEADTHRSTIAYEISGQESAFTIPQIESLFRDEKVQQMLRVESNYKPPDTAVPRAGTWFVMPPKPDRLVISSRPDETIDYVITDCEVIIVRREGGKRLYKVPLHVPRIILRNQNER